MTSRSVSQKVDTELGLTPTSQARPRDTDHIQHSNLAARTLSLVEHTLYRYRFGGYPCPVRPGMAAAVNCYARKARFSRCCSTEREKSGACVGFNTTKKGITCSVFCFLERYVLVGLTTPFAVLNSWAYPTCKTPALAKRVAYQVLNKDMYASSSCCQPTVSEDGTSVSMLVHQYHGNRVAFRVGWALDSLLLVHTSMILPYADDHGSAVFPTIDPITRT